MTNRLLRLCTVFKVLISVCMLPRRVWQTHPKTRPLTFPHFSPSPSTATHSTLVFTKWQRVCEPNCVRSRAFIQLHAVGMRNR